MVNRLQSVYILMARGATEGERDAAKDAYDRLMDTIRREYGDKRATSAEAKVKRTGQSGASNGPSYRYKKKPDEKPKQKRKSYTSDKGNDDGRMWTDKDHRTGWTFRVSRFTDPNAGKRGSDKIWGYAIKDEEVLSFWGPYGKTIRKKPLSRQEAETKFNLQIRKGYKNVDIATDRAGYAFLYNQFQ